MSHRWRMNEWKSERASERENVLAFYTSQTCIAHLTYCGKSPKRFFFFYNQIKGGSPPTILNQAQSEGVLFSIKAQYNCTLAVHTHGNELGGVCFTSRTLFSVKALTRWDESGAGQLVCVRNLTSEVSCCLVMVVKWFRNYWIMM